VYRLKLENTEEPSLVFSLVPQSGSLGKGLGVGTRFRGVGNRVCEGGQFSLLLEAEGWYIILDWLLCMSGILGMSGDGLLAALHKAALRSGYDDFRATAAAEGLAVTGMFPNFGG
jgi:hypothetical protein